MRDTPSESERSLERAIGAFFLKFALGCLAFLGVLLLIGTVIDLNQRVKHLEEMDVQRATQRLGDILTRSAKCDTSSTSPSSSRP